MADLVTLEWPHDGVALITVNDPDTPNHNITCKVITMVADAIEEAEGAGGRVVVLASGRPGFWFNHAYLQDILDLFQGREASGDPAGWARTPKLLADGRMVSIAAIEGETSGGGCELGWACDLRVAGEGATFSQPEVIIGVGTGIGGSSRLSRLIGRTATAEMVLMGTPLTAGRIYELGGLNRVVPDGQAVATALEMAKHMAAQPGFALAGMKKMLADNENLSLNEALDNDQAISQTMFADETAWKLMAEIQARYNSGQSLEKALWSGEVLLKTEEKAQ